MLLNGGNEVFVPALLPEHGAIGQIEPLPGGEHVLYPLAGFPRSTAQEHLPGWVHQVELFPDPEALPVLQLVEIAHLEGNYQDFQSPPVNLLSRTDGHGENRPVGRADAVAAQIGEDARPALLLQHLSVPILLFQSGLEEKGAVAVHVRVLVAEKHHYRPDLVGIIEEAVQVLLHPPGPAVFGSSVYGLIVADAVVGELPVEGQSGGQ
jgi:hypothetical protein